MATIGTRCSAGAVMLKTSQQRICVVGAGLAGGILASHLAATGHRVILVEQGTDPVPLIPTDEVWEGMDIKCLYTRGAGLGGTSNFWHGGLIVLDRTDIEGPAASGTGPRYPINYEHLCEYYRRALFLMAGDELTLEDLIPVPSQEQLFIPADGRFLFKPLVFPNHPFSTKPLLENAQRNHGLEIVHLTAQRLVFGNSERAAASLQCINPSDGKHCSIEANKFVLCAGGIGSPRILLNSAREGIALRDLPIGKFVIDHPTGFVFKARLKSRMNLGNLFGAPFKGSNELKRRWGFVLRPDCLSVAAGRNHVLYLRPALTMRNPKEYNDLKNRLVGNRGKRIRLLDLFRLLKHADLLMEAVNFKFGFSAASRHVAGFVFAEQLTPGGNKIKLREDGKMSIRWDISPDDTHSLSDFLAAFLKTYAALFEKVAFFPDLLGSGAHHSGGCRMASNATDGVVDGDLRIFGTDNVFVADGSVLGYSGHANTGLTIAALALKCADTVSRAVARSSD